MRHLTALVVSVALASTACAAGGDHADRLDLDPIADEADGLTIVDADASVGKLIARFRKDGRSVTYHLRLGPKMRSLDPADLERTDVPTHEIDGRVSDQEGRPMTTQMGGDGFLDPTWRMEGSAGVDPDVRAADFARARAAGEAFAAWTAPPGLEQLRLGAIELARANDASLDEPIAQPPKAPTEGGLPLEGALGEKAVTVNAAGDVAANYYWTYSIWFKNIGYVLGEHSAVRLSVYTAGGKFLQNWESCNHGSCAGASNMTKECVSAKMSDTNDTRYFYSEYSTSTGSGKAGCTNDYYWKGDADGKSHNCHNDTRLQRYAIATGSVGDASRAGNYGSLCAKSDILSPDTCPINF